MDDEAFLRKAFDVARRAREGGQHPFGCILVDAEGAVLDGAGSWLPAMRRRVPPEPAPKARKGASGCMSAWIIPIGSMSQ